MSFLDTAIGRLYRYIDGRLQDVAPYRAIVDGVDGDLVYLSRLGADTPDAEPYAKVTSDILAEGDEVMVVPVLGKPVVIGKVRRTEGTPTPGNVYEFSAGWGGRPGESAAFDAVTTAAKTLPAGTYAWYGTGKLTGMGSGGAAVGWVTLNRGGTELANGGGTLSYPSGQDITGVTTRTGTFSLASPTSTSFKVRFAHVSGTFIQRLAEVSVMAVRIA